MFTVRRAALRALSAAPSAVRTSSRTFILPSRAIQRSVIASKFSQLRFYATEPQESKEPATEPHAAQETAEEEARSSLSTSAEVTEAQEPSVEPPIAEERTVVPRERSPWKQYDEGERSDTVYVGNLYFEVTQDTLKREFGKYGDVVSTDIVYDGRGLSKGFAYIKFSSPEGAEEARNALNGQVLEGRRMLVNWAIRRPKKAEGRQWNDRPAQNPPSRTLFIGNLSYEMTDRDLNELFRDIRGVSDVRVAIDRRSGQPRGFAHADFLDVESATAAGEQLMGKEYYGRRLRVDFTSREGRPVRRASFDGPPPDQ